MNFVKLDVSRVTGFSWIPQHTYANPIPMSTSEWLSTGRSGDSRSHQWRQIPEVTNDIFFKTFFFRITQFNADVHNTHTHSPLWIHHANPTPMNTSEWLSTDRSGDSRSYQWRLVVDGNVTYHLTHNAAKSWKIQENMQALRFEPWWVTVLPLDYKPNRDRRLTSWEMNSREFSDSILQLFSLSIATIQQIMYSTIVSHEVHEQSLFFYNTRKNDRITTQHKSNQTNHMSHGKWNQLCLFQ
jgi:hypothetical protein